MEDLKRMLREAELGVRDAAKRTGASFVLIMQSGDDGAIATNLTDIDEMRLVLLAYSMARPHTREVQKVGQG